MLAIVLGGTGQFWGPVVGAFAFVAIDELSWRLAFSRGMVFGLLLIAVVFACPGGLAGSIVAVRNLLSRRGHPQLHGGASSKALTQAHERDHLA